MASTIEEIEDLIQQASAPGFRGRLLERGLARSMIWRDGELPNGAPDFSDELTYDLLSYGYSLLSLGIRLRELNGNSDLYRLAFERSATAISDVIHSGTPDDPERGFHRVLAAAAYHLGRFSAKAYSTIQISLEDENLSEIERALALLILRRFDELEGRIMSWKASGRGSDQTLTRQLETELTLFATIDEPEENGFESVEFSVIDLALTDNYFSSIFEFLFALEFGDSESHVRAISRLDEGISITSELSMVPQWWVFRVTKHVLGDLWESSFHNLIPLNPDSEKVASIEPDSEDDSIIEWEKFRRLFIVSLYKRRKSEIDLWPSQIEGAKRAVNDDDDLVIS